MLPEHLMRHQDASVIEYVPIANDEYGFLRGKYVSVCIQGGIRCEGIY